MRVIKAIEYGLNFEVGTNYESITGSNTLIWISNADIMYIRGI